ncbi:MAG: diguanylate cyclase [Mycobacterium sp.]|nr:diguanylate cyclase [Mycobacterium sp.]
MSIRSGVHPCDDTGRWETLLALLADHPIARLNAVAESGLFTTLPPAMAALGREQLVGRSGIEIIDPDDHGLALAAWLEVLATGAAQVDVRDITVPDQVSRLHFLDLRDTHGVIAALGYALPTPADRSARMERDAGEAPRLGRTCKDGLTCFTALDEGAEAMLGYPRGALVGSQARELIHPDDLELAVSSWVELLARPGTHRTVRLRHRRADGAWLWLDVTNHNLLADPAHGCVVSDLVDVTREMALREDIRAQERLLQRLAQALPVGLLHVSPRGDVVYTNERLHAILGVGACSSLAHQLDTVDPADRTRLSDAVTEALATSQDAELQVRLTAGTARRVCSVALRPVVDDAGVADGVIACVTDVTESTELRAELEHRATYDTLTGCLNRAALLLRLCRELEAARPGAGCAVLFLDLDGFKAVNDSAGHAAGDALLRTAAATLQAAARRTDAVGRIGGDEFVLVCPGVGSRDDAEALAVELQGRLRRVAAADAPALRASIGLAWVDDPAVDPDTVLAQADAAMYRAKRTRRRAVPAPRH